MSFLVSQVLKIKEDNIKAHQNGCGVNQPTESTLDVAGIFRLQMKVDSVSHQDMRDTFSEQKNRIQMLDRLKMNSVDQGQESEPLILGAMNNNILMLYLKK